MSRINKKNKTRKTNKSPKKDVHEFVHFRAAANNGGQINISWDDLGRLVCPEADQESVCVYKGYFRDSGKEKIVSKTFANDGATHFSEQNQILTNFDSIAAIDTNDFEYSGRNLSISASYFCKNLKESVSKSAEAVSLPFFIIENIQHELNAEVIGWHLFIKHIIPILNLNKGSKLALVVDSELGKHEAINSRTLPYYDNYLLPENVSLIYASADTGNSPINKLIKECDKNSKKIFKQMQEKELLIPSQLGGKTVDFSGYAYVNLEFSEYKIIA